MLPTQLVVFDFDWSLADQDTDRYVLEVLAPDLRRQVKDLKAKNSPGDSTEWIDSMSSCLQELHKRGKTRDDIQNALRVMPFHPAMARAVRALKNASSPQTTFLCLSNSNSVYISTILEHQGLTDIFDEIITNPAEFDDAGRLHLRPRTEATGIPHSCKVGCRPNMCKGEELDAYLARKGIMFEKICYVGDGGNDFCPITHLRSSDIVFVRRYRGLQERIKNEGEAIGLKPVLQYWAGAWELEEYFNQLIIEPGNSK